MSLVNGAEGIGTGWSTSIPCFNPLTICENIRRKLKGLAFNRMKPWFRGYSGEIKYKDDGSALTVKGRYEINTKDDQLIIKELPIQVWTRNYKNFLEELAQKDVISDIKEFHKDNNVHFVLTIPELKKYSAEQIEKDFRLVANISCSNYVLFDKDYKIKRYNSEVEILEEFFTFRYDMYAKRKAQMLRDFKQELDKYTNQHRFIKSIIDGSIKIFNKKKVDIEGLLTEKGFKKYEEIFTEKEKESILEVKNNSQDDHNDSEDSTQRNRGFDYLLSMNIMTFSSERMEKLEKMIENKS